MRGLGFALGVFFTLFIPLSSFGAVCSSPTTVSQLAQAVADGEHAFEEMSLEQLLMMSTRVRNEIVPCLREPVTPQVASAFHRLMALEAFTHKSMERVVAEFHAARKLDPGYVLSLEMVPEGHPLRRLYNQSASAEDGELQQVFPPDGGYVTVGGVRNAPRPKKTPVLIQAFDPFGKVLETRYVQPGETLPAWSKNAFGIKQKDLGSHQGSAFAEPRTWYIVSGVSLALSGVFYALALSDKHAFQDTSNVDTVSSDASLTTMASRANAFGVVAVSGASLAAVSAGIGAGLHYLRAPQKEDHR